MIIPLSLEVIRKLQRCAQLEKYKFIPAYNMRYQIDWLDAITNA